jgi:hypothetical protein
MKKILFSMVLVTMLVTAFGYVGNAYAQTPDSKKPFPTPLSTPNSTPLPNKEIAENNRMGFGADAMHDKQPNMQNPGVNNDRNMNMNNNMAGFNNEHGKNGLMNNPGSQDAHTNDNMIAYFAKIFGMSIDKVKSRLNRGETMEQIAVAKGFTVAQYQTLLSNFFPQPTEVPVSNGRKY